MSEHLGTVFLVSWQLCGGDMMVEEFIRKQEAMHTAEMRAMDSWQGTATVDMVILESDGSSEPDRRFIRSWEVSPEGSIQTAGARERKFRR